MIYKHFLYMIKILLNINFNNSLLVYRNCLLQTLKHCMLVLDFVKSKGVEVKFHGRGKNEASHYCGQCEVSSNYLSQNIS